MSSAESGKPALVEQHFDLPEPPQKVWRAISLPEFREAWLPTDAVSATGPIAVEPGRSASFRMRERSAPFLESTVTFEIASNAFGGTRLRILHELTEVRSAQARRAANGNSPLMRAA